MTVKFADIETARRRLTGAILRTPMLPAPKLSALTGTDVYVKYENLQVTNSFKDRGAFVKLAALTEEERRRGVICMSAGNHAQAVAYHAQRLNIPATIVMPITTTFVKVKATEAYGAKVVIDGGGLIAGNAIAARAVRESIEIVGVEAALYPSMRNAVTGANDPIGGPTLAEGIAVKDVGKLTLPVVRALVSDIVLVDEAHLERAVNAYLTLQKTMAEGAGAAGLAALLATPERFRGRKVGLILCGGNIDPRILASIMVRELERDGRIVSFRLTIPDRPGVLGPIASLLGELGANILEVEHRRRFLDVPAKGARLDITVEARDRLHAEEIFAALAAGGYQPVRIETATTME